MGVMVGASTSDLAQEFKKIEGAGEPHRKDGELPEHRHLDAWLERVDTMAECQGTEVDPNIKSATILSLVGCTIRQKLADFLTRLCVLSESPIP
jgi:hypothetical protein